MRDIKSIPVKKAFTLSFFLLVVLPMLIVLFLFIFFSFRNYYEKAIENISFVQDTMEETIIDEVNELRMTLAHIVYANDSRILEYINEADTPDNFSRYQALNELEDVLDYTLQLDSSVLSMIFTFDSGRSAFYKTELNLNNNPRLRHDVPELEEDIVSVSSFRSGENSRFYTGSNPNDMIYSAIIFPGDFTDITGNIKSIEFFSISGIYRQINRHDTSYSLGNSTTGYTAIIDRNTGRILSSSRMDDSLATDFLEGKKHIGYIYVSREVSISEIDCIILTAVRLSDITDGFILPGFFIFLLVVFIVIFVTQFSRLLMKNVIRPVKNISDGLRSVEDGNLDMHLDSEGYEEINATIHSFNGMVRHQRSLIDDYKSKLEASERQPDRLFASFVSGKLEKEDIPAAEEKLFSTSFYLMLVCAGNCEKINNALLFRHLDSNLHFASQCYAAAAEEYNTWLIYYRDERESRRSIRELAGEIQSIFATVFDTNSLIAVSHKLSNHADAIENLTKIHSLIPYLYLRSASSVLDLDSESEAIKPVLSHLEEYSRLASAAYIADARVSGEEKEKLNDMMMHLSLEEAKQRACALLMDFSIRLQKDGSSLYSFFGYYLKAGEKIDSFTDNTSLMIYINNLLSEISDISLRNIAQDETDMMAKAKRYISDNYQHSGLTLGDVSSYVGLNERYFSTCFTKQEGETFSNYLTALRIQNAKNLLKTTTFKVNEIASMSGYSTSENFNKAFKKNTGMTPNQYRKSQKI